MIHRVINLSKVHSFFLFGARGTGKSSLLKQVFADEAIYIDLLNPELSDSLVAYPQRLTQILDPHIGKKKWVIIDEVQKAPKLLDLVHQYINKKQFHFALTGSSARKLKRGSANLLAGRAFVFHLFPFTYFEIGKDFDLNSVLSFGALPEVVMSQDISDRKRFLKAYTQTYVKEEIISEQIVRNLPPFKRFLEVAALQNTEIVSYSNIAKDIDSDPKTVSNYYEILEDTLLGILLPSFNTPIRKQQKKAPKFYFFDTGVVRSLSSKIDYTVEPKSYEYGQMFESFIINEIHRLCSYKEVQFKLSYVRVSETLEIDLIIERAKQPTILCEIKSTDKVDERYVKSLEILGPDFKNSKKILISLDPQEKKFGEVRALHWEQALSELFEE